MDAFVTTKRTKEFFRPTATQVKYIKVLRDLLEKNQTVLVWGNPGVGKTFLVKHALEGLSYIDLENARVQFPESPAHLILDTVDFDGDPPRSLGSTLVVALSPRENYDWTLEIPPLPESERVEIAHKFFEGDIQAKGTNLRTFLTDLDFSHGRDDFPTPKEFIVDLLTKGGTIDTWSHAGHVVMEHGYSFGIVHENYTDAKGADPLCLSEWMSLADTQDDYAKSASFFSFLGIIAPCLLMNRSLTGELRPGSSWTKYNNHKMREKKFAAMSRKIPIDLDSLMVLNAYCLKYERDKNTDVLSHLRAYNFSSSDLDVMNHLILVNKMKAKTLTSLKKQLGKRED